MRSVLVGAVESTRLAMEVLCDRQSPPVAVVTLPIVLAGRHSDFVDLRPLAADHGVQVIEAANVNDPEIAERMRALEPDYLFVIGWSQICRRHVLEVPKRGAIGYHPALLPENRGRAVIPWTILQGCRRTGSTLFLLDEGVDSGDILAQEQLPVEPDETAATLGAKHMRAMVKMLGDLISRLAAGTATGTPQDHGRATYCSKRTPRDGLIDWYEAGQRVWTLIRAVGDPYPGAFTYARGKKVTVWEADYVGAAPYLGIPGQVQALTADGALVRCGDGSHLRLRTVQREGELRAPAQQVLTNHERLGIDWVGLLERLGKGVGA